MVIALLVTMIVLVVTGVMIEDGGGWGGDGIEDLHEVAANFSLLLVALHVAGVALASFEHGENLARAMIDGICSASTARTLPTMTGTPSMMGNSS